MSYILFQFSRTPYGDLNAQEALDAILAFAAFSSPVRGLFLDDGIFQLLNNQRPSHSRNLQKVIHAFDIYDVPPPGVCASSLSARGLSSKDLSVSCEPLEKPEVAQWIRQAHHIINF